MDMNAGIRQIAGLGPEIDSLTIHSALEHMSNPRDSVSRWMKAGLLVGVVPGHYVVAAELRKRPVSLEILANQIYGPSYVSFEFVLSRVGLIPEAVHVITSATPKRNRDVDTPLGRFSYRHLPLHLYAVGYVRHELPDGAAYLVARPEKAVLDMLYRSGAVRSVRSLEERLYQDFRIDPDMFRELDPARFEEYARNFSGATFSIHLPKLLGRIHG